MTTNCDEIINAGNCALIYMIDPPFLVSQSAPLLLSLRKHYPDATIIPYVPQGKLELVPDRVMKFHEDLNAIPRELTRTAHSFQLWNGKKLYKHGHKILACAEKRDTDYCIFFDTDTYLAQPFNDSRVCQPDAVGVVPEGIAGFTSRFIEIWDDAYAIFGLKTPSDRVRMLRTNIEQPPYFNAGFCAFPEETASGDKFGELWLDTAIKLDFDETIDRKRKRPWLDQASLPIAILRGDLRYEILESDFNYPLDRDFPPLDSVKLYHYHGNERIEAAGFVEEFETILVESGYFKSYDHYLEPLWNMREDSARVFKKIAPAADRRRELKKVAEEARGKDQDAFRAAKKEITELNQLDQTLRAELADYVEPRYYDEDWLVKR